MMMRRRMKTTMNKIMMSNSKKYKHNLATRTAEVILNSFFVCTYRRSYLILFRLPIDLLWVLYWVDCKL